MIIDCHFHLLAKDDEPGCHMSRRLEGEPAALVAHLSLVRTPSGSVEDPTHVVCLRLTSREGHRRAITESRMGGSSPTG